VAAKQSRLFNKNIIVEKILAGRGSRKYIGRICRMRIRDQHMGVYIYRGTPRRAEKSNILEEP
jgi:hypothetical protein